MVTSQRKGYSIQCGAGTNHAALDGFNSYFCKQKSQMITLFHRIKTNWVQAPRIRKPKGKGLAY
ncbi:12256_t:CDS:2 [Dentiscutata heterogama]|uniref:12256_t:CDS:1 n=1 Tax=Dentiscutata heterogama TaxID=1316150 RepID=A0ACA9KLC4_9GLOM|nr:12256_t:CDS:2 [Dentiscutata heterogama]